MEAFALYLLKSSVWLTGFAAVYFLFLRNERFFVLNRIFLLTGILASIGFPFFTWRYTVVFPVMPTVTVENPQVQAIGVISESAFQAKDLLLYVYLLGALYLIYRLVKQTTSVWQLIRKSETLHFNSVKLIRSDRYPASFSFFSFVFVNPSTHEHEINEIVNHEQEHIRQRHWIDLLLFEILCTIQWFNPAIWIYGRFIRQNHEFLADEYAIRRSPNPAIYRAALINQMFGVPVISLGNSFNYSINKKRFNMMKQITYSPFRKLKLLLVLPLIAGVFYAFATPIYKFEERTDQISAQDSISKTKVSMVSGNIIEMGGKPLKGVKVVVPGQNRETTTDANGDFNLMVPMGASVLITHKGFEDITVPPGNPQFGYITMQRKNPNTTKKEGTAPKPKLIFVDGKKTSAEEMNKIDPNRISSMSVINDEGAVKLYGPEAKDGVIKIILKHDGEYLKSENTDPTEVPLKEQIETSVKIRDNGVDGFAGKPLLVTDGIIAADQNIEKIDPASIISMNVLKGSNATSKYGEQGKNGVIELTTKNKPLYIVDGFVVTEASDIKPETIESIDVLKGESATKLYGDKGKNGVISITLKKSPTVEFTSKEIEVNKENNITIKEPSQLKVKSKIGKQPLLVIDGVVSKDKKVKDIDPNTIESMSVWKDEKAIEKYGEKGRDGVIEFILKKDQNINNKNENLGVKIRSTGTAGTPLIVVDGFVSDKKMDDIKPETIESINVLKGEMATKKYGNAGKNGVLEITLKKEQKK